MKHTFSSIQKIKGSRLKVLFLVVGPLKGGGLNAVPLKKITFLKPEKKSEKKATKLQGWGFRASLFGRLIKKSFLCGFPKKTSIDICNKNKGVYHNDIVISVFVSVR